MKNRRINEKYNEIKNDLPDLFNLDNNKLEKLKKSNNKECIICLENFKINNQCLYLNCLHLFHSTCIVNWLLEHNNCPICKENYKINSTKLEIFLENNANNNNSNRERINNSQNNNNQLQRASQSNNNTIININNNSNYWRINNSQINNNHLQSSSQLNINNYIANNSNNNNSYNDNDNDNYFLNTIINQNVINYNGRRRANYYKRGDTIGNNRGHGFIRGRGKNYRGRGSNFRGRGSNFRGRGFSGRNFRGYNQERNYNNYY